MASKTNAECNWSRLIGCKATVSPLMWQVATHLWLSWLLRSLSEMRHPKHPSYCMPVRVPILSLMQRLQTLTCNTKRIYFHWISHSGSGRWLSVPRWSFHLTTRWFKKLDLSTWSLTRVNICITGVLFKLWWWTVSCRKCVCKKMSNFNCQKT